MTARLVDPVGPDDDVKGSAHALITLVEYGDFECPQCGRAYPIVKAVREELQGWLRVAYRIKSVPYDGPWDGSSLLTALHSVIHSTSRP